MKIGQMPPKELHFITGNSNKLVEVASILGDTVQLRNQPLDLTEIQGTIEDISVDKCKRAALAVNRALTYMEMSTCSYTRPSTDALIGQWTSFGRRHLLML